MNTRKNRTKNKLYDDIPMKDVLTPNNRSGKKSVLTPCRRIGLGRKKVSKSIPVVPDVKHEDLTAPLPTTSQENGESSSLSDAVPSSSASQVITNPSTPVDDKPKSSASRRKKSSHPLKRKIDETDKSEGNTYKVIVSPVLKKRKLEFIDIFNSNSNSQNLSNITNNKIVINNVKNKNSDNILTKNNYRQNKVNTTAKNKQNVGVKVSLPLEISQKVLNSPKLIKSDKKDFNDSILKCDDKIPLLNKKLNINTDANIKLSETIAIASETIPVVLLPEMKPIKKRKLREKFCQMPDLISVINIDKEGPTSNNTDTKLSKKNVEEEITSNKLSEKTSKKTKTTTTKSKPNNKSLSPKNKTKINNISKVLNESKNNDFDDDFRELTPRNKRKVTIRNKKIVNAKVTPKKVKNDKLNLNTTTEINVPVETTSGRKKKNAKQKSNEITSEENTVLEITNSNIIVDESLRLSEIEPKQMVAKIENSIITTDKDSETIHESVYLSNTVVSNNSSEKITEICETNFNTQIHVSDIIIESTVFNKNELEITITNKELDKINNTTLNDQNTIKTPKTKAERKFYNIETATRTERKCSSKNRDSKSPPKLSIRVHKNDIKSKMDDDQLLINEDSYESSHYSTPAYSPIEEAAKLPEDKELIIQRCEFVKLSTGKKDNFIYECCVRNFQSPELKTDSSVIVNECASSFVQNEQNLNLNADNILPELEHEVEPTNQDSSISAIADNQKKIVENEGKIVENEEKIVGNEEKIVGNEEKIVKAVTNDILCKKSEECILLETQIDSSRKEEKVVLLVDNLSESDVFLPSNDISVSRKKENVFKKGKSVKNSIKGKSIVQRNIVKTDINADQILQIVKKGLRITKSLPFNNKRLDAKDVENYEISNDSELDREKEVSEIILPPKKSKLLNYYPRVLLNADNIANYYKNIELKKSKADELINKVNKPLPARKKLPVRRKSIGTSGRKRKRKNSEVVEEVEIPPEKNFDSHIQEKNLIISRVENVVSEDATDKSKYKNKDKDNQKRTESVFFTPPSSRSENDSDSNRNDFHIDVELTQTNPFGEGTSRLGITKKTEDNSLRNVPTSNTPISQDNYTIEDQEVACLSSNSSSVESNAKRKVSSRSSPTQSNVSTTKFPFSEDSDDDFQTPKSQPKQIPSKQYVIKNDSGVKCILKKPLSRTFKQFQLNNNCFVTQLRRGNVMEYIKSYNNHKNTKPDKRQNNKSLIQNRCIYSSSPETISSIFDSVIEDPEAYLQSQNVPRQRKDIEHEIRAIQKRIKEKEAKIEHLRIMHTYKKKHELANLHKANTKMIKGAQEALLELAAVLRQRSDTPFDMSTLLGNMNIPHHVVCYNMDLDEFTK